MFVVLIAQIAHTLADDVSWVGFRNFALVFSLIWIAWINGSFYHELHGREDGRSRSYIFGQMTLLVLLSVYASHAADDVDDGRGFAIVYALLLTLIALQWNALRKIDTPEHARLTLRYVMGMVVTIVIVGASAIVDDQDIRLVLWAIAIGLTVAANLGQVLRRDPLVEDALRITESIAERFGLFTIIMLGEVVVGVADGLSEADRGAETIATGVIALIVGFGFWWNYFDLVGRRTPERVGNNRLLWNVGHFPVWLGIAGAGAGMVSLIEHATDGRTPSATAWLVTGCTALMTLGLAVITTTMPPHEGRRLAPITLTALAVTALVLGAVRPAPLVLVLLLAALLAAVWIDGFLRYVRAGGQLST